MRALVSCAAVACAGLALLVGGRAGAMAGGQKAGFLIQVDGVGGAPGAYVTASTPSTRGSVSGWVRVSAESRVGGPSVSWTEWKSADCVLSGAGFPYICSRGPNWDGSDGYLEPIPDWWIQRRRFSPRARTRGEDNAEERKLRFTWIEGFSVAGIRCESGEERRLVPATLVDPWTRERYPTREDGLAFAVAGPGRSGEFLVLAESCAPARVETERVHRAAGNESSGVIRVTVAPAGSLTGVFSGLTREELEGARVQGWAWDGATGAMLAPCTRVGETGFEFANLGTTRCIVVMQACVPGRRVWRGRWEGTSGARSIDVPMATAAYRYEDAKDSGVRFESGANGEWSVSPAGEGNGGAPRRSNVGFDTEVIPGRYLVRRGEKASGGVELECDVLDGVVAVIPRDAERR